MKGSGTLVEMFRKFWPIVFLFALLAFSIPIEHKYDKFCRFFSLTLIPEGVSVSPQYEKKICFYRSDWIAMILCIWALKKTSWQALFKHPLWIVFLCALASVIASPFHSYPIPYFHLWQLFTPLIIFSILRTAFDEKEREILTRAIWFSLLFAGLFQSTVGILQYFHEGPIGLRLLGEPREMCIIDTTDGMRWTLDRLFHVVHASTVKIRASGTLPHANVYGGFLMLSLFTTYGLFMKMKKSIFLYTIPLQFFAMALSYSRSALLGWLIGSTLWFIWMRKESHTSKLALTLIGSVLLTGGLLYEQIIDRGGIVNYTPHVQSMDSVRIYQQNLSMKIIQEHPLFGLGYTQFSEGVGPYFPPNTSEEIRGARPHNIYLYLACETGLISLAAFLFSLAFLLYAALKAPLSAEATTCFATLIGFLFIGCCDFYPILPQQGKLMLFLIAGLLAAHTQPKPRLVYAESLS